MFKCPQCDTPLYKPECACGFVYRQPHQLGLQLIVPEEWRKPVYDPPLNTPYDLDP